MPQGRRRAPFSGKAKKQQMQAKKQRQNQVFFGKGHSSKDNDHSEEEDFQTGRAIQKINKQPRDAGKNKYNLQFFQESPEELRKRKEEAFKTIEMLPLNKQEVADSYFPPGIDFPKRPPWDFSMSKEELENREQKYFREYLENMKLETLSYFELNLETWRQLWRVLEMSDVLLIIVDIRYTVLMFPPYFYKYVTETLGKEMIVVLNKIDLAPAPLVVAWREYFKKHYPQLHILMFTSYPNYNLRTNVNKDEGLKKRRRKGKLKMAAEGAKQLLEACKEIVGDKVDLTSWQEKIQEEMNSEYDLEDLTRKENVTVQEKDTSYFEHEKFKNGVLTIGCVGTPNVGKSSLMNALMGKKVVSVSRTPGHTKHFQTIFLTKTVCLCDCPGLVFPSTVPKELQIMMGSFPISQVREPYSTIKYLAERVNLPGLLKLQHQDNDDTWSAMDICDSWAAKRNYKTAKAARLDSYRAANSLLRMTLEGTICFFVYPPGWSTEKESWEKHPDVEIVKWIQANNENIEEYVKSSASEFEDSESLESHSVDKNDTEDSSDSSDEDEIETSEATNKFEILST